MSHENNMAANNEKKQPKRKRGPSPVIVPKEISDWIRKESGYNPINSWKKGGGHKPWNGS